LIDISVKKSHNIIKKGDFFSVYVNVTNGHEQEITIKEIRLFQPTGFIPIESTKPKRSHKLGILLNLLRPLLEFFGSSFMTVDWEDMIRGWYGAPKRAETTDKMKEPVEQPQLKKSQFSLNEVVLGPFIRHPLDIQIQPKATHREDFNLKAGWSGGLRPRPDTYTISGEVVYELQTKKYQSIKDIEVSIFPSVGSMLVGTLVGSVLGTIVKVLTGGPLRGIGLVTPNDKVVSPLSWGDVFNLLPLFFVNLILGLLIGIILMRKKDVQPFLTVEDFWGGILLGFFVGYLGLPFLFQFGNISPNTSGNLSGIANMTGS
jgi:hypothetical protein